MADMTQPALTMPVPEGSVIITPAQVYTEVVTLTKAVTELLASDAADAKERSRLESRVDGHDKELDAIKAEVGTIKQKLWFVAGFAAAAGGGIGSGLAAILAR